MARTALVVAMTVAILAGGLLWPAVPVTAGLASGQTDISGPAGSGQFGARVLALPSGNIVVTDPLYDSGEVTDAGAVYLYNGATGAQISTLTGSNNNDQVGSGGVVALDNGNYVVRSPDWNNDGTGDAGAVTWGNGTTGVSGTVSDSNSLVGGTAGDRVGNWGVTALTNGNYVVLSPYWHNGGFANAGAATWGNGATGTTGLVSASNSLVGSTASDWVGNYGVTALTNGNYVVLSAYWNGTVEDAGAATWGNGTTGTIGTVSDSNSLVGGTAGDQVGNWGMTALTNGNYVVLSPYWHNGGFAYAGAATWGNGTAGTTGLVSSANSLVGTTASDQVGGQGVTALTNGNYVVRSPYWHNGGLANAGAATWGNGATGTTGPVSASNSLVGSTAEDQVGWGATALSNGNYVVRSPDWNNDGTGDAGAVTWGNGTTGTTGLVSASNSLVGSTADDRVGSEEATALTNGNYVVRSPYWHNGGLANAGAATWGNGATGTTGLVSASNSLVGSTAEDQVGWGATALSNGNYVVESYYWDNAGVDRAGAATWGNGTTGTTGLVSASNSLVGSAANDWVGEEVTALTNGNYVVLSSAWNGAVADAGAATWGDGTTGSSGLVSATNSLVGGTANDYVSYGGGTALTNGHYVVFSPYWDNGAAADAGAVTWGHGMLGLSGTITAENSVRGTAAGGGPSMVFDYDYTNDQLVVGRPAENIVTLFKPSSYEAFAFVPLVLKKAS